ncbi:TetR/AcrR family transcriptional regulator [Amycolatopsis sp. CA-230715]|uniref:TetR/AcrR family transcriptional regulator n=1 Tax=Amycolatopsis sp. CA-230715 TaxID=2745196 RepID=UPI001C00B046|nr:TetR/AcrR family transcriptional regulator [Amycolatopsis sp. CA-230715]QWF83765.1 putative HTH-type transcriptional regulator [Amycolatopsis sp. CA-230715]
MAPQTRRRGEALEAALLEATWAELGEVGYAALTMERVAERAKTSRMVLYRRWPNRARLVLAAMRRQVVPITEDVPDTGELRGDVLEVLRRIVAHYRQIGADITHGLMSEFPDLADDVLTVVPEVLGRILERAAERGEVPSRELPGRVLTLPADLVRHELLVTRRPVSERVLAEIVDDVFLPLLSSGRSSEG